MDPATMATGDARRYFNADMLEPEDWRLAGGEAAVVSMRRPDATGANQDAAGLIAPGDGQAVLIVADGCGGMASGEEAARLAVDALVSRIAGADPTQLRTAILDGVDAAQQQIMDMRIGAGATLAVVHLEGDLLRTYHVGDTQILLVGGGGKVKLLSTSHSPVGYAVESGMLDQTEALDHDDRHLVSNYLGCETMHVEVGSPRPLAPRDALLVASDGVLDNLTLDELVELLRTSPARVFARRVAARARQRMVDPRDGAPHKPDDLTLVAFSRRGCLPKPRRSRTQQTAEEEAAARAADVASPSAKS